MEGERNMEGEMMMEGGRTMVRSNSWIERLVVCKDCKHVAMDQQRHNQHLQEARHIHSLRNMAYR
jgi:hypothetical protein